MDVGNMFSTSTFNIDSMFKMSDINTEVQQHLTRVYACLGGMMLAATAGVITHLNLHIGGMLSLLATIGLMFWMMQERDPTTKFGLLMGVGFMKGASIGGLVELALFVDPGIVLQAVLATTIVFACFSASALLSQRRSFLYLGGTLSSVLSFMFFSSLFSMFWPSMAVFNMNLYLGLFVFCGYVLFDTQMIVEKASILSASGALSPASAMNDALQLFIDLVGIFVRILIILLKNSGKGKREERRGRR